MVISSSIPEDEPKRCRVCGSEIKPDAAKMATAATSTGGPPPCARCGHARWFTWESLGDTDIIKPMGDLLGREELDGFLDSVAIRPGVHLVLDLSDVHYFASAALSRLIDLKKRVSAVGGRFTIRNIHRALIQIFQIAQLDHVFEIEG